MARWFAAEHRFKVSEETPWRLLDSPPLFFPPLRLFIIIAFVSVTALAWQVRALKTSPIHLLHSTRGNLNDLSFQRSWAKTAVF